MFGDVYDDDRADTLCPRARRADTQCPGLEGQTPVPRARRSYYYDYNSTLNNTLLNITKNNNTISGTTAGPHAQLVARGSELPRAGPSCRSRHPPESTEHASNRMIRDPGYLEQQLLLLLLLPPPLLLLLILLLLRLRLLLLLLLLLVLLLLLLQLLPYHYYQ